MSFFYRLSFLIDDIKDGVKEVTTFAQESKNEFSELMTDGFKEMVIKDNNDYKTSYEKRDKSHAVIKKAHERLKQRADEVTMLATQTEYAMEEFYTQRHMTMQQILNTTNAHLQAISYIHRLNSNIEKTNLLRSFSSSSFSISSLAIPSSIVPLIAKRQRVEEANSMLEEAYVYERDVDAQIATLNSNESKLKYIHKVIAEEKVLLSRLYQKISIITQEVDILKMKTAQTESEKQKIQGLTEIIQLLTQTLQIEFIEKNLKISPQYERNIESLGKYLK